jgi:hypothetical protein
MSTAFAIAGGIIALFLGRHYFRAWRRGLAFRRFFAAYPAAVKPFEGLNKNGLTDKRIETISTESRGKRQAVILTFHGPIRIAVDGEGHRYGYGGGTWHDC